MLIKVSEPTGGQGGGVSEMAEGEALGISIMVEKLNEM